jgi:hypothetical protein
VQRDVDCNQTYTFDSTKPLSLWWYSVSILQILNPLPCAYSSALILDSRNCPRGLVPRDLSTFSGCASPARGTHKSALTSSKVKVTFLQFSLVTTLVYRNTEIYMSRRVRPAQGSHWSRPYALLPRSQGEQALWQVAVPMVAVPMDASRVRTRTRSCTCCGRSGRWLVRGRPSLDSSDHDLWRAGPGALERARRATIWPLKSGPRRQLVILLPHSHQAVFNCWCPCTSDFCRSPADNDNERGH